MASVNKVILIGNLGRDPEIRFSSDNSLQIATLALATSSYRRSPSGERTEEVEWHRVVLFGRTAEIAQQYLRKGSPVYIEGRLRTRRWEKEGQTHYSTEIIGESMQLLGSRGDSAAAPARREVNDDFETSAPSRASYARSAPARPAQPQSAPAAPQQPNPDPVGGMEEDDIPF